LKLAYNIGPHPHPTHFDPAGGGSLILYEISIHLQDYAVSQTRRTLQKVQIFLSTVEASVCPNTYIASEQCTLLHIIQLVALIPALHHRWNCGSREI